LKSKKLAKNNNGKTKGRHFPREVGVPRHLLEFIKIHLKYIFIENFISASHKNGKDGFHFGSNTEFVVKRSE